jgi:iron complex transport system substrate-binding protein
MYKKIASLAPSNTEILYALGEADNICAVTRYCDYPTDAKQKPKVGGWLDINDELVKGLSPDLILTSTFVQDKITERYKESNMNIVSLMPKTLEGVFESILKIGQLAEKKEKAEQIVSTMKTKINEIKNKISNNQKNDKNLENKKLIDENNDIKKPRVYVEEWHKPPTVSGNWVSDLVEIAGGDYSLIKSGEYSKKVSTKQIVEFDPEIIIISICGIAENAKKEWITKRVGWENISAVKNDKVFVFDDSLLNRPGPRLVLGLENLARVIHPESLGPCS